MHCVIFTLICYYLQNSHSQMTKAKGIYDIYPIEYVFLWVYWEYTYEGEYGAKCKSL